MSLYVKGQKAAISCDIKLVIHPSHMEGKQYYEVEADIEPSNGAYRFWVREDNLLPVLPVKTEAELIDLMAAWAANVIKICPYMQHSMMEEKAVMREKILRFLEERANRLTCDDCTRFDGKEHCQPREGILRHIGDKTLAIQLCPHFEPRKEVKP